ncbi:MAG: GPW/gp25 family protein [Acidobacteriota bacterium]
MAEQHREFLGRGWAFPTRPDASGRLRYESDEELVTEGIEIVLGTSPGERQMRPEFGCAIYELVGEANTAALRGMVRQKVREALLRWEPRIDVMDVRVESPDEQKNRLDIRIDYRIRSNNAFFNLVYPFFLTEGPQQ